MGRNAEDGPARLGDLRHLGVPVHFREQHQGGGIAGVDADPELGEQGGVAPAQAILPFAPAGAAGDVDVEAAIGEPPKPVDGGRPTPGAALGLMQALAVMVE